MDKIAGIILSGGLAKRFQTKDKPWIDKAIVEIEGKPILIRLIEILKQITDEIIIIVNNDERKQTYLELLKKFDIKLAKIYIDEKGNCKGALLGILTGMKQVKTNFCMVLPCDLPYIKVQTLKLLLEDLSKSGITLFAHKSGVIEPLPACISVKHCLKVIKLVCKLGKRRIDDIFRGYTELVLVISWRVQSFDPGFKSFINLNSPNDLKESKIPQIPLGTVANSYPFRTEEKINIHIDEINENIDKFKPDNLEPLLNIISELIAKNLYYWVATLYEFLGRYKPEYFNKAADFYLKESNFYYGRGMLFLARHAELDQKWCLKQLKKEYK
ncbi:MAG: molybdenum cofactor guanylyltransferase [Candidatus Helarchaeota archaeon]|nr:molybdenum cofactor guanylyltransferase [Candidatus Helarchaeota archaeon]